LAAAAAGAKDKTAMIDDEARIIGVVVRRKCDMVGGVGGVVGLAACYESLAQIFQFLVIAKLCIPPMPKRSRRPRASELRIQDKRRASHHNDSNAHLADKSTRFACIGM
jgi:hypothetical protein